MGLLAHHRQVPKRARVALPIWVFLFEFSELYSLYLHHDPNYFQGPAELQPMLVWGRDGLALRNIHA